MASKWQELEARYGKPMADIMLDLYRKYGPGIEQEVIAAELGVSQPTVSQWMKLLRFKQSAPQEEQGGQPEQAALRRF